MRPVLETELLLDTQEVLPRPWTRINGDVGRRCDQHNAGTASRYTRSRLPIRLVYDEIVTSRSLALKREAVIKALSRIEKESLIQSAW